MVRTNTYTYYGEQSALLNAEDSDIKEMLKKYPCSLYMRLLWRPSEVIEEVRDILI